jgi:NAD(P)-dependent dehydrogenase (short-subunit alcohol dehydrogenase family)
MSPERRPQELRFDGRVAVVTGATSGLGRAYALELARRGATVVATSRPNASGAAAMEATAREKDLDIQVVPVDVTVETEATALVLDTVQQYGQLDVLVNNAGAGWVGALHDGSTAQLRAMLDVHLMATFWTMLPALGHMRARGRGRIVNTVSGTGMFPRAGTFAYAAAKAAVQAMTRSAALDNSDLDIGINAISPIAATPMSPTYTEVHPALDDERMSVHRVVPALVFLAHPSCRLTGEVWHAAGGRVARAGYYVSRGWGSDTLTAEDVAQHVEQICDVGQPLVLQNSWQQYDYIPKGPDDYEAWR